MATARPVLIQVLPRLLPTRCGISDYAILLALELESAFDVRTAFVVLNSNERSDLPFETVYCPPSQLEEACLKLSEGRRASLLLPLSGYGYSPDGAPTILADTLEQLKPSGMFRIAVYFCELFASGMPWTSAFWYSNRQRKAIRRIANACDFPVTNTGLHANWLNHERAVHGAGPVQILSAFSQAGEAQVLIPAADRDPVLAVFGLQGTRERAYRELKGMNSTLFELGIREILDIGPEMKTPSALNGIPVRQMGLLGHEQLHTLLSKAKFGFVSYSPILLGKSGVFAAYCAHGTIPLVGSSFAERIDGLEQGVHVLNAQTANAAQVSGLDSCSIAGWNWYAGHRLRIHASTYAHWLTQN